MTVNRSNTSPNEDALIRSMQQVFAALEGREAKALKQVKEAANKAVLEFQVFAKNLQANQESWRKQQTDEKARKDQVQDETAKLRQRSVDFYSNMSKYNQQITEGAALVKDVQSNLDRSDKLAADILPHVTLNIGQVAMPTTCSIQ